jgi:hypothetical protein
MSRKCEKQTIKSRACVPLRSRGPVRYPNSVVLNSRRPICSHESFPKSTSNLTSPLPNNSNLKLKIFPRDLTLQCSPLHPAGGIWIFSLVLLWCSYPWNRRVWWKHGSAQQHSILSCLKIGPAWAILGSLGESLGSSASFNQIKSGGSIPWQMVQFTRLTCLEMWGSCPCLSS